MEETQAAACICF